MFFEKKTILADADPKQLLTADFVCFVSSMVEWLKRQT